MLVNRCLVIIFLVLNFSVQAQVTVVPQAFDGALKNPLKGFTTNSSYEGGKPDLNHPWASTAHVYVKWNALENDESDDIQKIIDYCNVKFAGCEQKNIKVIPRVFLHWNQENLKYWPADMTEGDYSSEQFNSRLTRLVDRLGQVWDNDPRIAWIELGIFGKFGEHHSLYTDNDAPTIEMQQVAGAAFNAAFKNKKVLVRHNWKEFQGYGYGVYWDSWAHYDQMWLHGNSIRVNNDNPDVYKTNIIGGEVAYGWGNFDIQAGSDPTESCALPEHRNFIINSIKWLHCTQFRWISLYDQNNADAVTGAEEIQKALGYRFEIQEATFSLSNNVLDVSFDVKNTGAAPFYYNWPVEVALLDPVTLQPVWKSTMTNVDIRNWMPGEQFTDPDWTSTATWQKFFPDANWNVAQTGDWLVQPNVYNASGQFNVDLSSGEYVLALSVLDPGGNVPSLRFATSNYINGGRHPLGMVDVSSSTCSALPGSFQFDNPQADNSLYYTLEVITNEPVTGVTISGCPSSDLVIGGIQQLTVEVSPTNATDQSVIWTSSDTSIVTVDATGLVTAQGEGSATITVTTNDGGHTDNCLLSVISSPVYSDDIIIASAPAEVSPGEIVTVNVEYEASTTRDISAFVQLNSDPWTQYGKTTISVSEGTGTVNIDIAVDSSIPLDNTGAYKIVVDILPSGGVWADRLDEFILANINAVEASSPVCDLPWSDTDFSVTNSTINYSSGLIDISCAASVTISVDIEGIINNTRPNNYCNVYYKVDGGAQQVLSLNSETIALKTVSVSGIAGNTVEIIIEVSSSHPRNTYNVSNINVNADVLKSATSFSTEQVGNEAAVHIYPNPTQGFLHIDIPDVGPKSISLYSITGELLYNTNTSDINVSIDLKAICGRGMVLIKVKSDNSVSLHKVIVK